MAGLPSLLEKIANQTLKQYGRKVNTTIELLITAGATQGVFTTINTFVNHGDEVLILDPSYDSYEPSVLVAGGKPVRVSLNDDYTPNFNRIESAISAKTKLIVINNPHNPSGRIWTEQDFEALENIVNFVDEETGDVFEFSSGDDSLKPSTPEESEATIIEETTILIAKTTWESRKTTLIGCSCIGTIPKSSTCSFHLSTCYRFTT